MWTTGESQLPGLRGFCWKAWKAAIAWDTSIAVERSGFGGGYVPSASSF